MKAAAALFGFCSFALIVETVSIEDHWVINVGDSSEPTTVWHNGYWHNTQRSNYHPNPPHLPYAPLYTQYPPQNPYPGIYGYYPPLHSPPYQYQYPANLSPREGTTLESRASKINPKDEEKTSPSPNGYCFDKPHKTIAEYTGKECESDSFFCVESGLYDHCCKCRPGCCGSCKIIANINDPYQACPEMQNGNHNSKEKSKWSNLLIIFPISFVVIFSAFVCYQWLSHTREEDEDNDVFYDPYRDNIYGDFLDPEGEI
jgi:hypothetical protein